MNERRVVPELRQALLRWYGARARVLPWRGTQDPYRIALAEVLLQQTRVQQALGYYERFVTRFPTWEALAAAAEGDVLKAWAGAGYYARARRLHAMAREVAQHGMPRTAARLRTLPGVGPYTAAAVASIAFGEPVAVVDGNVRRVLSRLAGVARPAGRWLWEKAEWLLDREHPGRWNQALMELGALVCTPRAPACADCPLGAWCEGKESPEAYPEVRPRKARAVRVAALVLTGPGGTVLVRRDGASLGGLWGVPLAEGGEALVALLAEHGGAAVRRIGQVRHAFTHKRLTVDVYVGCVDTGGADPAGLPLSRLDEKILALAGEHERDSAPSEG